MRALVGWGPVSTMTWLDRELGEIANRNRVTDDRAGTASFLPPADVVLAGDDAVVNLELPGVDVANDVEVEVDRGQLVVRGHRAPAAGTADGQSGTVLVSELRHGRFQRVFTLPEHVTGEDVEAGYDRGVLTIRVRNVVRPGPAPKRIAVTAG